VLRGVLSPREMETPIRTFLNWYRRADYTAYAFNTRPVARHPCPEYERHRVPPAPCRWRIPDPAALLDRVVVLKKPDPEPWKRVRTRVVHISVLVLIDRTADIRGNVAS